MLKQLVTEITWNNIRRHIKQDQARSYIIKLSNYTELENRLSIKI